MRASLNPWGIFCFFLGTILPLRAEPTGGGHGKGGGEFQGVIHALFDAHEKIDRVIEFTDSGYRSKTTSQDREVAALLQKHVAEMAA